MFGEKIKEQRYFRSMSNQRTLNQYFTPRWAAQAIVDRHFAGLNTGAIGLEPSCGDGRFLMALPEHLQAIGVEIDPVQAALARINSGRQVITGDFLEVELPGEFDFIVGNPPFVASTVAAFLERAHGLLRDGGECGFLLPSYILQTSTTVMKFADRWSISTEMLPRNLFPGLSLPITFTMFKKDRERKLFGLFLYQETAELASLTTEVRQTLNNSSAKGSVWRQVVNHAFDKIGREAVSLTDIYAAVERRPTANPNWAQQIRKVLQTYKEFTPVGRGFWARVASNDDVAQVAA